MTLDLLLFLGLALIAVLAAAGMLASRDAVYSALFLVLNFLTVAMLYLLLNAAFIAMVQVTVYAGAIMVLFLQPALAVLLVAALAGEILFILLGPAAQMGTEMLAAGPQFGSPASVGRVLFSEYLVPFEVISILLLVAMVGAIVITRVQRRSQS